MVEELGDLGSVLIADEAAFTNEDTARRGVKRQYFTAAARNTSRPGVVLAGEIAESLNP